MPRSRPSAAVIHGSWVLPSRDLRAGFAIWGEQSPNVRVRPRIPRRRAVVEGRGVLPSRPGAATAAVILPHPFSLSDDGVRHALSVMGLTRWVTQTNVRQVYACLPTRETETPSEPHRSTEPVDATANLKLALWAVQAA